MCLSSLRGGHANLLCMKSNLSDDLEGLVRSARRRALYPSDVCFGADCGICLFARARSSTLPNLAVVNLWQVFLLRGGLPENITKFTHFPVLGLTPLCRKRRIAKTRWTNIARSSKAPRPQLLSLSSPPSSY